MPQLPQSLPLTFFDIAIIILCVLFLVRGIWVGFIRQISFLAALALGYIAAGKFHHVFLPLLDPVIPNRQIGFLLTYLILFLLVYVGVMLIGVFCRRVMQITFLGWFDRLVGGVFGLTKGVFLCHVLFLLLASLPLTQGLFEKSLLSPYLKETSARLLSLVQSDDIHLGLLPKAPAIGEGESALVLPPPVKTGQEMRGKPGPKAGYDQLVQ